MTKKQDEAGEGIRYTKHLPWKHSNTKGQKKPALKLNDETLNSKELLKDTGRQFPIIIRGS